MKRFYFLLAAAVAFEAAIVTLFAFAAVILGRAVRNIDWDAERVRWGKVLDDLWGIEPE